MPSEESTSNTGRRKQKHVRRKFLCVWPMKPLSPCLHIELIPAKRACRATWHQYKLFEFRCRNRKHTQNDTKRETQNAIRNSPLEEAKFSNDCNYLSRRCVNRVCFVIDRLGGSVVRRCCRNLVQVDSEIRMFFRVILICFVHTRKGVSTLK